MRSRRLLRLRPAGAAAFAPLRCAEAAARGCSGFVSERAATRIVARSGEFSADGVFNSTDEDPAAAGVTNIVIDGERLNVTRPWVRLPRTVRTCAQSQLIDVEQALAVESS